MPLLPNLADKVWFAYNCLPRDAKGNPPSYVSLERPLKLPNGTFSRVISGAREDLHGTTLDVIAKALNVELAWLLRGGDGGPVPSGIVPPRPGTIWKRHGELPGWEKAAEDAKRAKACPPAAFRAGADMPVYRPVDQVTPELALAAARYAWETSTLAEQRHYSLLETRKLESKGRSSGKQKAI